MFGGQFLKRGGQVEDVGRKVFILKIHDSRCLAHGVFSVLVAVRWAGQDG
jgi:hypothetical protein